MSHKIDYRSTAGILLRGKNVYNAGSNAPNPVGHNQYSKIASLALKRKRAIKNASQHKR